MRDARSLEGFDHVTAEEFDSSKVSAAPNGGNIQFFRAQRDVIVLDFMRDEPSIWIRVRPCVFSNISTHFGNEGIDNFVTIHNNVSAVGVLFGFSVGKHDFRGHHIGSAQVERPKRCGNCFRQHHMTGINKEIRQILYIVI